MIFIDLQQAFNTIDHKVLSEKMKCMAFYNDVSKWFECCLSKRVFSVNVENSFSDKAVINCAVPKGCILEPLLLLNYVNYMLQGGSCDLLFMLMTQVLFFNTRTLI